HPTDQDFKQKPLINALKKADYLWTLTESETNYFIKNFNINPKKIILAGNGVDLDFLKKEKLTPLLVKGGARGGFNILFIGSLSSHKRVDLLIKSFSDLMSSLHQGRMSEGQVGLKIAGQKTLFYPQIEKLVKSLNPKIKSKIKFIFSFPQKDLSRLIDNCDVLVLPSIQESFGLVVIEAWARKKPVICADIPALKELVKKSNGGLLFKADDQNDLTKQIQFILNNPKKAQQMGQLAYKYVKNNYTWNKVGEKICQKVLS
ncbi:MAG: glycosyltransferase family 4 protein, partial [Candidatus Shapirobacteria bacterium]|nr:glycosyltransferase family 4 protein [Candidatus Shapirobacteria bacterium]